MPTKNSGKKAMRQSRIREIRNKRVKLELKTLLKKSRKSVDAKTFDDAQTLIKKTTKALAMAAQKGIIKKNTAARKTSRLSHMLNKHESNNKE